MGGKTHGAHAQPSSIFPGHRLRWAFGPEAWQGEAAGRGEAHGAIRAPGSFRKKWSFPQVLIGFNTILWSNDLDDLGVPPFYTTTICVYIYNYILLCTTQYSFIWFLFGFKCVLLNNFGGMIPTFFAIFCRALTPQASHSFLGFMTYMSVLVGQINM